MWHLNILRFGYRKNVFILSLVTYMPIPPSLIVWTVLVQGHVCVAWRIVMSIGCSSSRSSISPFPPPAYSPPWGWWEPGSPGRVFAVDAVAVTHLNGDTRIYHNKGFLFVLGTHSTCPIFCIQEVRQWSEHKHSCCSRGVLRRRIFVVMTVVNWIDMPSLLKTRRGCK